MTPRQRRVVNRYNNRRGIFDIQDVISGIIAIEGETHLTFRVSRFTTNTDYDIFGSVSHSNRDFIFSIDRSIQDTPKARYAFALLLAIYTEIILNSSTLSQATVYLTSNWEAISYDLGIEGRGVQRRIQRIAREILINDDLFEEDYEEGLSLRQLSERYGVPRRIISEKFDDMGF